MPASRLIELPAGVDEHHLWLSHFQMAFFRRVPLDGSPDNPGLVEMLVMDLNTGTISPAEAFNVRNGHDVIPGVVQVHHQGVPGHEVHYQTPRFALSPNGVWMAWLSTPLGNQAEWIVATLDGERQYRWWHGTDVRSGRLLPGYAVWANDSSWWVALSQTYQEGRYSFDRAIIRVPDSLESGRVLEFHECPDGLLVGMESANRVLLRIDEREAPPAGSGRFAVGKTLPSERVPLGLLALDQLASELVGIEVRFPRPVEVWDVELSPNGERLAWIVNVGRRGPYEIWVGGLHDEELREIASFPGVSEPAQDAVGGKRYHWPRRLSWRPGSHEVSFVYRNAIWVAPVD